MEQPNIMATIFRPYKANYTARPAVLCRAITCMGMPWEADKQKGEPHNQKARGQGCCQHATIVATPTMPILGPALAAARGDAPHHSWALTVSYHMWWWLCTAVTSATSADQYPEAAAAAALGIVSMQLPSLKA